MQCIVIEAYITWLYVLINGHDTATHRSNNSKCRETKRRGVRLKWTVNRNEYTQTVRVNFVQLVHNDVSASFYLLPVTYDSINSRDRDWSQNQYLYASFQQPKYFNLQFTRKYKFECLFHSKYMDLKIWDLSSMLIFSCASHQLTSQWYRSVYISYFII